MEERCTIITVESKIFNLNNNDENTIINYCKLQSHISRTLFNFINNNEITKDIKNELQRNYIKKYNIHARLFKSTFIDVKGKIQSILSNNKNYKKEQKDKLKKLNYKLNLILNKTNKSNKDKNALYHLYNKINHLNQLINNEVKVKSTWGSKVLLLNKNKDINEWKEKRDYRIYLIGSKDESFGNSLCQLQTLNKLKLTLPRDLGKKLELEVNFDYKKRNYDLLKTAIANKQALTYKIFKRSNSWYVQVSFELRNNCPYQASSIGVDVNYNLITTCHVKKDGNPSKFIDYNYDLEDTNKHQNNQILIDISNEIVYEAKENNKNIIIEDIKLDNNKRNCRKVSLVAYNKFRCYLRSKAIKEGVLVIEVNPAYSSFISKFKYMRRLGRSIHSCAAYVIGRRGMKFGERLPIQDACCLQSEKDKSSLKCWARLYKLRNVSSYLKSCYIGYSKITQNSALAVNYI